MEIIFTNNEFKDEDIFTIDDFDTLYPYGNKHGSFVDFLVDSLLKSSNSDKYQMITALDSPMHPYIEINKFNHKDKVMQDNSLFSISIHINDDLAHIASFQKIDDNLHFKLIMPPKYSIYNAIINLFKKKAPFMYGVEKCIENNQSFKLAYDGEEYIFNRKQLVIKNNHQKVKKYKYNPDYKYFEEERI